jgi:hypothetical protein
MSFVIMLNALRNVTLCLGTGGGLYRGRILSHVREKRRGRAREDNEPE